MPACSPRQQQVRHVHAGNQQNEPNRREQGEESGAKAVQAIFREGENCPAHVGVFGRVFQPYAVSDGFHFRARLCDADAGLEARDGEKAVVVAPKIGLGVANGNEEAARSAPELPLELGRHHADEGKFGAIDANGAADERRVAVVARLPESVREDHFAILAQGLFFWQKRAPEKRLGAKHLEEPRRDAQAGNLLRFLRIAAGRQIVPPAGGIENGHRLKRPGPLLEIPKVRRGDDVPIVRAFPEGLPDDRQAIRAREGDRLEQRAVHHAENGGVGPDAER